MYSCTMYIHGYTTQCIPPVKLGNSAGTLEQSMWARYRDIGIGLSYRHPSAGIFKQSIGAHQATQPGGIGSLKSILGLIKSLKIRTLAA